MVAPFWLVQDQTRKPALPGGLFLCAACKILGMFPLETVAGNCQRSRRQGHDLLPAPRPWTAYSLAALGTGCLGVP